MPLTRQRLTLPHGSDGDGNLDLFIGKQNGHNGLWMGDGACGFTATTNGPADAQLDEYTMTAVWGDVNGDGFPDLFVGHRQANAELWINDGLGNFSGGPNTGGPTSGGRESEIYSAAWGDANGDGCVS